MKPIDDLIEQARAIIEDGIDPHIRATEDKLQEITAILFRVLRIADTTHQMVRLMTEIRNTSSTSRRMRSPEMAICYYVFGGSVGTIQASYRRLVIAALELLGQQRPDLAMSDQDEIIQTVRLSGLNEMLQTRTKQRSVEATERKLAEDQRKLRNEDRAKERAAKTIGLPVDEYDTYVRLRNSLSEMASLVNKIDDKVLARLTEEGVVEAIKSRPIPDGLLLGAKHRLFLIKRNNHG